MRTIGNSKLSAVLAATVLVCAVTACGGGGNGGGPGDSNAENSVPGTDLPVATTKSVPALIEYARKQQAATSDTTDPVTLGDSTLLASDDTGEPSDI